MRFGLLASQESIRVLPLPTLIFRCQEGWLHLLFWQKRETVHKYFRLTLAESSYAES